MAGAWKQCEEKINDLVKCTEQDVSSSLAEIQSFGLQIDEKFRKMFLNCIQNRLKETYDKFEMELSFLNQNDGKDRPSPSLPASQAQPTFRPIPVVDKLSSKPELVKQQNIINHVHIEGVPKVKDENLRAMFFELCRNLDVKIFREEVLVAYRNIKNDIVIELNTPSAKERVFRARRQSPLWSTCFGKYLPSNQPPKRIYITDRTTDCYMQMMEMAESAINGGLIHSCRICLAGLEVMRVAGGKKIYFSSLSELGDFINNHRD